MPGPWSKRRRAPALLLAFLLVLTSIILGDPGAPGADAAQDRGVDAGGVYRRPLGNDPATLDPAGVRDVYSLAVVHQIFDGLVQFDQTLAVTPALAQFWKASRDGLSWTFTLRKGIRFHHGREVTADDVVYSLTRLVDPRTKSGAADHFLGIKGAQDFRDGKATGVSGLQAVDRHTVQVTLTEASGPFVSVLAVGHAKIVPREVVEKDPEAFASRPVGTGPFRFVRWERGKEIVLAANPDYFDGPPRLSRVVYRIFPGGELDRMFSEFQAGSLEDSPLPARDYRQATGAAHSQYVRRPMFSLRHYGFVVTAPPLDDKRVRQAIILAVDREAIVEEDFLGRYAPARGILPPGTLGYNPKLKGYPHDPGRARELLAQAGHPGGKGLPPIVLWSSVRHEAIVKEHERIVRDLAAVGVKADFQYVTDWPTFSRQMAARKFPVFLRSWSADVPDPDNFLFRLFHSQSPRNYMGYVNPAVDALLLQARATDDGPRRVELYRKAEELIVDDAPVMPVWHYTYERLFQPYVRAVEVSGLGDPYIPLRKIWLERPR
jgi:oligopeptide transport system substrate-binding protein